jgi:hypothetical protein
MRWKTWLFLIQVHSEDIELQGGFALEAQQQVEQSMGIFATRQAHHHAIAIFNHVVIVDGFPDQAT